MFFEHLTCLSTFLSTLPPVPLSLETRQGSTGASRAVPCAWAWTQIAWSRRTQITISCVLYIVFPCPSKIARHMTTFSFKYFQHVKQHDIIWWLCRSDVLPPPIAISKVDRRGKFAAGSSLFVTWTACASRSTHGKYRNHKRLFPCLDLVPPGPARSNPFDESSPYAKLG